MSCAHTLASPEYVQTKCHQKCVQRDKNVVLEQSRIMIRLIKINRADLRRYSEQSHPHNEEGPKAVQCRNSVGAADLRYESRKY